MNDPDESLPSRMRDYRLEAQLRENPDLHQLAQLFIAMALDRTQTSDSVTLEERQAVEVELKAQEANG